MHKIVLCHGLGILLVGHNYRYYKHHDHHNKGKDGDVRFFKVGFYYFTVVGADFPLSLGFGLLLRKRLNGLWLCGVHMGRMLAGIY